MSRRRARSPSSKWWRKSRSHLFRWLLKSLPLAFVFGIGGFIFFGVRQMLYADPNFRVERITVFPSGILSDSEYEFLESKASGRSLLEIDLNEISRSLERNPKVKRAEAVRQLPRQLNVFLTGRVAAIQVALKPGGPYYLVAEDQMVLSKQREPQPELMTLEHFESRLKTYAVGSLYQNEHFHLFRPLLEAVRQEPALQAETISKLIMDRLGNVALVLKDGIELRLGQELKLTEGARMVLGSILKPEERTQILYVDLRYRDVVVKKKTEA